MFPIDSTDYSLLADELTFEILSTVGEQKCQEIEIFKDDVTEPPEEFVITLINPNPILDDIMIQEPSSITVTISDCESLNDA